MDWTRSDTIALARNTCTLCHGLGLRFGRKGQPRPCNCVLRAIFRACYAHFRHCATKERYISRVAFDRTSGRERCFQFGRKDEEFIADFVLVSRRTLAEADYRLFNYHFLLGADWRLCCRKLNITRGTFFHKIYRMERELGRVFRELQPYSLYPLDDYYNGPRRAWPAETRRWMPAAAALRPSA